MLSIGLNLALQRYCSLEKSGVYGLPALADFSEHVLEVGFRVPNR